jgi:hypothetical protein
MSSFDDVIDAQRCVMSSMDDVIDGIDGWHGC